MPFVIKNQTKPKSSDNTVYFFTTMLDACLSSRVYVGQHCGAGYQTLQLSKYLRFSLTVDHISHQYTSEIRLHPLDERWNLLQ